MASVVFNFTMKYFHLLVAMNSNILVTDQNKAFLKILKYFINFQTFVFFWFSRWYIYHYNLIFFSNRLLRVLHTRHIDSLIDHTVLPTLHHETFLFLCLVLAFDTASCVSQDTLESDMMLRLASNLSSSYPSLLSTWMGP